MGKIAPFLVAIAAAIAPSMPAAGQCLLCSSTDAAPAPNQADRPIVIEVISGLDFDRVAVAAPAGGSVELDPMSRSRMVRGEITDLGGLAMVGAATVRGEPGRAVRVDLPNSVTLTSSDGSHARLDRLITDLPVAPRLDADGMLRFSFGGKLEVSGEASGDYRGRIAITVDYQ